jgi:hypothetical protein
VCVCVCVCVCVRVCVCARARVCCSSLTFELQGRLKVHLHVCEEQVLGNGKKRKIFRVAHAEWHTNLSVSHLGLYPALVVTWNCP